MADKEVMTGMKIVAGKKGLDAVEIEELQVIWKDRKRNGVGLPWTFTRYEMTKDEITMFKGLFVRKRSNVDLYKVIDTDIEEPLFLRILGVGTVIVTSSDATTPCLRLENIKNPKKVERIVKMLSEECKKNKGVHYSEVMGMVDDPTPDESIDCDV